VIRWETIGQTHLFGGGKGLKLMQTPIYDYVLPDFVKHFHLFCHLRWQLWAWQNSLADWQTFANHTSLNVSQYSGLQLILKPLSRYVFHLFFWSKAVLELVLVVITTIPALV
jgi:hypothetical protein